MTKKNSKIIQSDFFEVVWENFSKKALTIHKYYIEYNRINFITVLLEMSDFGQHGGFKNEFKELQGN